MTRRAPVADRQHTATAATVGTAVRAATQRYVEGATARDEVESDDKRRAEEGFA